MNKQILISVVSIFILVQGCLLQSRELKGTEAAAKAIALIKRWGEAVNGLRAAVEFVPEKKSYSLGEEIGIRFHIQNVSDRTIQFTTAIWRNDGTVCILEDDGGRVVRSVHIIYLGWVRLVRKVLELGQTTTLESASLGIARDEAQAESFNHPVGNTVILKPGHFSLRYQLRFPDVTSSSLPQQEDDWRGTLETGKRELVIIAASGSDKKTDVQIEVQRH